MLIKRSNKIVFIRKIKRLINLAWIILFTVHFYSSSVFARQHNFINLNGKINFPRNLVSVSGVSELPTQPSEFDMHNAYSFSIMDQTNPEQPFQIALIASLSKHDFKIFKYYTSIINNFGEASAFNSIFELAGVRLIGYLPPTDSIYLDKKGFIFATYDGITLYNVDSNLNNPELVWSGGNTRKNAFVRGNHLYDFHGIKSIHIYDITSPNMPILSGSIDYSKIQYHHNDWNHKKDSFEYQCDKMTIHPKINPGSLNFDKAKDLSDKSYYNQPTNEENGNIKIDGNLVYISHYTVGFRIFKPSESGNISLTINSIRSNINIDVNRIGDIWGIYPSVEKNHFYIYDRTGIYIFTTESNRLNLFDTGKNSRDHLMLSRNYPNPFNPITTIEFELLKDSDVKLSIYNILGQKVTDLVNKHMHAGLHKINFNAASLASGTYFYELKVGNLSTAKKLNILK